ncbi:MAG: extracellular solute-binding protein [Candidatus Coatesbacteria bacterium]
MGDTTARLKRWFPVFVIAAAFVWACAVIVLHRTAEAPEGTIVIRVGHWQLETSVREAFDTLARDYQKLHPNVRIVQDAIPETTYGQWVTTNLMGGTAPDLMEIGIGVTEPLWISYQRRYFHPLTQYTARPNPYNRGTPLENTPLRQTFADGMRSAYIEALQEYMKINLSQFGVRIFYNKGLLKKLTGLDEAPRDYHGFLAACEEIKKHTNAEGKHFVPIACSGYHFWMWEMMMADQVTYPALARADFNRDGYVGNDENWVAFKSGRLSFDFPAYRARFRMIRQISDEFQVGYTGLTRDDAVLLFAQQKAVFMPTGTWDSRSLQEQAKGSFEVGLMEFPRPTDQDPEYGEFIKGPLYEVPWVGFPFGIVRTSKHPDVALDFLLFLASQPNNEKFNRIIGWIPSVVGCTMDPLLEAFKPKLEGVYGAMNFGLGGETWVRWSQDYSLFQVNQIDYDELAKRFGPFYIEKGLKDFMEVNRDWRRTIRTDEEFLAGIRAKALLATGDEAASLWIKYRSLTAMRQVLPEVTHARLMALVTKGPDPKAVGPYEHSPEVLDRVRARLKGGRVPKR